MKIEVMVGTKYNLEIAITRNPKILHLICHGKKYNYN